MKREYNAAIIVGIFAVIAAVIGANSTGLFTSEPNDEVKPDDVPGKTQSNEPLCGSGTVLNDEGVCIVVSKNKNFLDDGKEDYNLGLHSYGEESITHFENALTDFKNIPETDLEHYSEAQFWSGQSEYNIANQYDKLEKEDKRNESFRDSIQFFLQIKKDSHNFYESRVKIGQAYYNLHEYLKSIEILSNIPQEEEKYYLDSQVLIGKAHYNFARDVVENTEIYHFEKAKIIFTEVLKDQEISEIRLLLGNTHYHLKEWQTVMDVLTEITPENKEDYLEAQFSIGRSHYMLDKNCDGIQKAIDNIDAVNSNYEKKSKLEELLEKCG